MQAPAGAVWRPAQAVPPVPCALLQVRRAVLYCEAMTRKQKLILIILGVLDFIVISALIAIVVHTSNTRAIHSIPAASPNVQAQLSPCTRAMLETCAALPLPFDNAPAVAWDATHLYVTLRATYPAATPPQESAQLLWTALDAIAAVLQNGCTTPETITIALAAYGNAESVQYLAQFAGSDVAVWVEGTLPEDALAAQSRFRQTRISTDRTD